jgi:hypothetical protein
MVQTRDEENAKKRESYAAIKDDPEFKTKRKIRSKIYNSTLERKKARKEHDALPESKKIKWEREHTPEFLRKNKLQRDKPERKKTAAATTSRRRKKLQLDIFSYFSKLHSNSDIPCCRCCGLNDYIEFLSLDHIQGKIKMDSIKELTDLKYTSEKQNRDLWLWIKNNNYLSNLKKDYFQVLCHNCNQAKSGNKQCPHTRK